MYNSQEGMTLHGWVSDIGFHIKKKTFSHFFKHMFFQELVFGEIVNLIFGQRFVYFHCASEGELRMHGTA